MPRMVDGQGPWPTSLRFEPRVAAVTAAAAGAAAGSAGSRATHVPGADAGIAGASERGVNNLDVACFVSVVEGRGWRVSERGQAASTRKPGTGLFFDINRTTPRNTYTGDNPVSSLERVGPPT